MIIIKNIVNLVVGIKKVKEEYGKVQWPKKKEITESTSWVITMSVALGCYIFLFDFLANGLLKKLVSLFGG